MRHSRVPPQTLGTRSSLDNCAPLEPLIWAWGKEKEIFVQKLNGVHIFFKKYFSLGLKKDGAGHLACSTAIPAMSQDVLGTFSQQLLQSLQSRGPVFVFRLLIIQKGLSRSSAFCSSLSGSPTVGGNWPQDEVVPEFGAKLGH